MDKQASSQPSNLKRVEWYPWLRLQVLEPTGPVPEHLKAWPAPMLMVLLLDVSHDGPIALSCEGLFSPQGERDGIP